MTKTIAQNIKAVSSLEDKTIKSLVLNYDKVYQPLFDSLIARSSYFDGLKGGDKVNQKKQAYDIEQGLRDDKGEYLIWSLSEISQYTSLAAMGKTAFCDTVTSLIDNGKTVNTLKTLYKEIKASERAEKNAGKKGKNETAKKAAKTREQNKLNEAMQELTDGFLVCQKAFEISQSDNYGNMTMPEIEKAMKSILSAMLKDNDISSAKADNYSQLKKTG